MTVDPTSRRAAGFTLIEVLAAVFLTAMVIGIAVSFYINLSDHSTRAAARTRETLHAAALLDRVANDLKNAAMLVKAEEADPLSHPWYFVAEQYNASYGADRIRFISRSNQPRVTAYHSADLTQLAYFIEGEAESGYVLYRWLAPGLPESADLDYPTSDDERSLVLGENLASFGMRFLQEDGEWTEEWDSTQLLQSSQLPVAIEITATMLPPGNGELDEFVDFDDLRTYKRTVAIPMRPLDLVAMIEQRDLQDAKAAVAGGAAGGAGGIGDISNMKASDIPNFMELCTGQGVPGDVCQAADRSGLPLGEMGYDLSDVEEQLQQGLEQ